MSGNRLLLDTNILLYLLSGDETLSEILEGKRPYVSFVTELELYGFQRLTASDKSQISEALSQCTIIDINAGIKMHTVNVRQDYGVKLPDSIIAGTSLYMGIPLITSDKGFNKIESLDLIYYENNNLD